MAGLKRVGGKEVSVSQMFQGIGTGKLSDFVFVHATGRYGRVGMGVSGSGGGGQCNSPCDGEKVPVSLTACGCRGTLAR